MSKIALQPTRVAISRYPGIQETGHFQIVAINLVKIDTIILIYDKTQLQMTINE